MGVDDEFEEMRKLINRMLQDFFRGKSNQLKDPLIYGFSMKVPRSGVPEIREWGNMKPTIEGRDLGEKEPVYDLVDGEEDISVTVELPGVSKHEINLRVTDLSLIIEANSARRYWKFIDFPEPVDASSLAWTFNNGVLDVILKKRTKQVRID